MENRTKEPQDPKCKNWIWTKYSGRKKLKQNWKKAIRFKLLEFCKTGTKKSSPDLFNFYVDLAGNDMVNDAGQTTTCRRKFKTPWLQTKVQKMKDHPKMSLTEKRSKIPDGKKIISSLDRTTPWNTRHLKATNEAGPRYQEELNSTKLEKKSEIRSKLLDLCNTRSKKPSLDKLNFYLVSAARHMLTDNDKSTTCRRKFKAPSLKTNTKWKDLPKTCVSSDNCLVSDQKNQKFQSWHGKKTTRPQR